MLRDEGRAIEHVRALAAELAAYVTELPTAANNSPTPPAEEPRALSTGEAARLLGVTPYTLNEWARLGRIRCRQDSPGGRRYFDAADVAAYTAEHTRGGLTNGLDQRYRAQHDTPRGLEPAPTPQNDASRVSRRPRGDCNDDRPVGTRPAHRRPPGTSRPYCPGSHAWHPKEPEG